MTVTSTPAWRSATARLDLGDLEVPELALHLFELSAVAAEQLTHLVRLPVTDGGNVVGILSILDLVKSIMRDQEFAIGQLQSYITGH